MVQHKLNLKSLKFMTYPCIFLIICFSICLSRFAIGAVVKSSSSCFFLFLLLVSLSLTTKHGYVTNLADTRWIRIGHGYVSNTPWIRIH
jgi:hypothetical protein